MKRTSGRLAIDHTTRGSDHQVVLDGQIDERTELQALADLLTGAVTIDLERVSFINSMGVREWIRFARNLHERGVTATLRRCSEAMIHQFNMIIETTAGIRVESFYAPYHCEACGGESSMLLELETHREALARLEPPPLPCPECKGEMRFDEVAGRYLVFVQRAA